MSTCLFNGSIFPFVPYSIINNLPLLDYLTRSLYMYDNFPINIQRVGLIIQNTETEMVSIFESSVLFKSYNIVYGEQKIYKYI